ncbi:NAD(P)/FAD-dependent oxidoreductase [Streptomyces sp. NPDC057411]|uniref:NAD(P)/FAD-dependent oxidoreductase n=1 Tax=unclassified Streptomyces TaxID=2593676 RepID=UPI00362510A2
MDTNAPARTAVILGAGIAGLATSRVLSDSFHVILVEPHALPADDRPRGGVPQAHHLHGLNTRGLGFLEELFPGLDDEVENAGYAQLDPGRDALTCFPTGTGPLVDTDLRARLSSRALLEARMRARVLALPTVELRTGQRATGLVTDSTGSTVRAVTTTGPDIRGDLIIDATGRFSRLPRWLADAGLATPPTRTVDAGVGYASALFEAPDRSWRGLIQPTLCPDRTRGAYIAHLTGRQWMVTLYGTCGDHPPTDMDGFRAFAETLDNPAVTALFQDARPVSRIRRYIRTENHFVDYHRMRAWPDRLLVIGDAACALNPVYGTGIGAAVEQALLLRALLDRRTDLTGLARDFQRRLPRTTAYAWRMSTFQDAMWARHRTARPTRLDRAISWYLHGLYRAAVEDAEIMERFHQVFHRAAPPTALLSPRVIARTFRGGRSTERANRQ